MPTVTKTTPFSSTGLPDAIILALAGPVAAIFALWESSVATTAAGEAAAGVSGIVGPLLSGLPYAIPFANTFITAVDPTDQNPMDFPVLALNWTSVRVTDTGVVGGIVATLYNRTQDVAGVTVQGQTEISVTPNALALPGHYPLTFFWTLQNLAPGSCSWSLSHDVQSQGGNIAAGPFTQAGAFTVSVFVPRDADPRLFVPDLSVTASEACGSDPSKVLTGAWSTEIAIVVKTDPGHDPLEEAAVAHE